MLLPYLKHGKQKEMLVSQQETYLDIKKLKVQRAHQRKDAVKNSISYIQRKEFNTTHKSKFSEFETNWIEVINSKNQNIIIGVVYRHPRQKDTEFLNYMKQTLKTIDQEKKKVILTGDFNFNLLKFDKPKEVNEFLNYLIAKWYTPHILGPTRLTEHQQLSFTDNIFLNFNDMHCNSGNLLDKI